MSSSRKRKLTFVDNQQQEEKGHDPSEKKVKNGEVFIFMNIYFIG